MRSYQGKIVFIGQALSKTASDPWTGAAGKRLADLMDTTQEEMLARHEFRNLLDKFPGKAPKGDLFPMWEAREAARKMAPSLRGRRVVLLGAAVSTAFQHYTGLTFLPKFLETWRASFGGGARDSFLAVVPHPSGTNRWYNDPENKARAAEFLRRIAREWSE